MYRILLLTDEVLCFVHADKPFFGRSMQAYRNFSNAIKSVSDAILTFERSRCIGCYVLVNLGPVSADGTNLAAILNDVIYVGKGDIKRAASHIPDSRSVHLSQLKGLSKKQVALVSLLLTEHRIGIIHFHCCRTCVAFAVERVLIKHFKSSLLNIYSGHKRSLPDKDLAILELAALEFLYSKINAHDYDLVFK